MTDSSLLSKVELGTRSPNLSVAMMYQVLCEVKLKELFPERYEKIKQEVKDGVDLLIPQLNDDGTHYAQERKRGLEQIQARMNEL